MAYHIWTDTSANLPAALCKQLGIGVLPFHFIHNGGGEECCLDTDAFPYEAYYEDLKAGGTATTNWYIKQTDEGANAEFTGSINVTWFRFAPNFDALSSGRRSVAIVVVDHGVVGHNCANFALFSVT